MLSLQTAKITQKQKNSLQIIIISSEFIQQ